MLSNSKDDKYVKRVSHRIDRFTLSQTAYSGQYIKVLITNGIDCETKASLTFAHAIKETIQFEWIAVQN